MGGTRKVIVAISGASGAILGVRLLQALRAGGQAQTHLVVSDSGALTAAHELGLKRAEIEELADVCYKVRDIGAAIASGSFLTAGMVVAPCSMKTLASIAHGLADNLIARAADVVLKERRRLVLVARETPLNFAHLRNMCSVTEMGGIVMPPVPAFYAHPRSVDDIVDHSVGRMLDLLGLDHDRIGRRWEGLSRERVGEREA